MPDAPVGKRWVEQGLVGLAGVECLLHGVVDFQNDTLGVVFAVFLLVFTFDDGKGFHDGVHVVANNSVEEPVT